MNKRLIIQRMCWKELRQLLPLLVLLPTIAIALHLLYQITGAANNTNWPTPSSVIFLAMPGLYAVGAGALLVGQEKELKTILWLSSLPISPTTIVRTKSLVALFGLVTLWLITAIFFALENRSANLMGAEMLPLNSLFILFAGIALAWWTSSPLVALVLVVPAAILPVASVYIVDAVVRWGTRLGNEPSPAIFLISQAIFAVIAVIAADRMGRCSLAPQASIPPGPLGRQVVQNSHPSGLSPAHNRRIQAPIAALIWQFTMQSRVVLLSTGAMLLVAGGIIALATVSGGEPGLLTIFPLLALLATSWLGASVFQGDSSYQRIRFLADRGVSPNRVWFTRHAMPVAVLSIFVLMVLVILVTSGEFTRGPWAGTSTSIVLACGSLLIVYVVSHWISQIVISPVVTSIAAPIIAIGAVGLASFAMVTFATPWWIGGLVLSLPLVATFLMTRRWMDRRFGLSYWVTHGLFLVAILIIPTVPHMVAILRQPGMPSPVATQLEAIARRSSGFDVQPIELVMHRNQVQTAAESEITVRWDNMMNSLQEQLDESALPVGASSMLAIESLRSIVLLMQMTLQRTPGATKDAIEAPSTIPEAIAEASAAESLRIYQRAVALLSQIAARMRQSPRLIDQDAADLIEIGLVTTLQHPQAKHWLGELMFDRIAYDLADIEKRREARSRAIALSWSRFHSESKGSFYSTARLGGYDLTGGIDPSAGRTLFVRQVGNQVTNLWRLVHTPAGNVPDPLLNDIAQGFGRDESDYGLGPRGKYKRANNLKLFEYYPWQVSRGPIANQWLADWETQATHLPNRTLN